MTRAIELLETALQHHKQSEIARKIGVSRQAINTCLSRKTISPAIAWGIAEMTGENPMKWALLAAAEGEKESGAKDRMLKSLAAVGQKLC